MTIRFCSHHHWLLAWLLLVLFAVPVQGGDLGSGEAALEAIERQRDLRLGVYVKRLSDEQTLTHRLDRDWYLASTIKIPLAIAIMQQVEEGDLSLDRELELAESDYVDGSGELLYADPGERYTIDELNRRSVAHSDSTATDMLIRMLGQEAFNQQVSERMVSEGFGPMTTILQVRHEAYSEIHPEARDLTNMDFIDLKRASDMNERYERLLEKLGIAPAEAKLASIPEAFERYYDTNLNAGDLSAMGRLLERLAEGELLSDDGTERVMDYMRAVNTGDQRIKAGLPEGADFAHKTGTQIGRACNVGIVYPQQPDKAVVVAACAEGFGPLADAEAAFADLGRWLSDAAL